MGQIIEKIAADVLIAGGGLTGVAAAIALARANIRAIVVESRQTAPPDRWGMMLWPSAAQVLEDLGISVDSMGRRLRQFKWFTERDRQWVSADLGDAARAQPFVGIAPARLLDRMITESVRLGTSWLRPAEVVSVERERGSGPVRVVIRRAEGAQVEVACRLLVIADGAQSRLRDKVGIKATLRRAHAQRIYTCLAGPVGFSDSRQAFGYRWSGGCVPLGAECSWFYAVAPASGQMDPLTAVQRYRQIDADVGSAMDSLQEVFAVTPTSVRVTKWSHDRCMLLGDSAHGMFPFLGFGASASFEDIPVFAAVATQALARNSFGDAELGELQRARESRVTYLRRASELFSLALTSRIPAITWIRDWNFRRLIRDKTLLQRFLAEVSDVDGPDLCSRLAVLLP